MSTWTIGLPLLMFAILVVGLLTKIERRIIRLQRWVEMHAEPAPQLSEEKLAEKKRLRIQLGYPAQQVEQQMADERRRRRRLSLAQYVVDLRAMARRATRDGSYDTAAEYLTEADQLVEGEK